MAPLNSGLILRGLGTSRDHGESKFGFQSRGYIGTSTKKPFKILIPLVYQF